MKRFILLAALFCCTLAAFAQERDYGKIVYEGPDITFRVIDDHTWHGYGKLLYNESVYVIEGNDKVLVLDAGAKITDLAKIIASLSPSLASKPMVMALTHLHGDHAGSAIHDFSELWHYPAADMISNQYLSQYKGKIGFIRDGFSFNLGGRTITAYHTPGHTDDCVTFFDFDKKYGFCGDSFGSTSLLVYSTVTGFRATCLKVLDIMKRKGVDHLYPGHSDGGYCETPKTIQNEVQMCDDILSGKKIGTPDGNALVLESNGQRITYYKEGM